MTSGVRKGKVVPVLFGGFTFVAVHGRRLHRVLVGARLRIIPSDKVGVVEKWWSPRGSLKDAIISLHGEAGYQPTCCEVGSTSARRSCTRCTSCRS